MNRQDGRVVSKRDVTDGPYAETKGIVIGFSIIEANDFDQAAIAAIEGAERLQGYPFCAAARGELELRSGHPAAARPHFQAALALARNDGERNFLRCRLELCPPPPRDA